ncbi:TetR/AcrR family transcriptional regulator [Dictyobacter kobayashii]|uniref:TetR family transcriptional regulator n=1 Tax=Dictyobacter kobayashii TaxID=2014872 RepID=A0A402ACH5_9CHLR|nr:TetR/AcrR family transcriptional regulator [Dictyobacter kobayashii]GCE16791.1 TetR family transcriptional regulator [Dictyobacter kobayashii]
MKADSGDTTPGPRQDLKEKYLLKLLPVIKQRGFSHLRIDDIARYMDISKATFYKYFASKEEVIEQVVDMVVAYFYQAFTLLEDDSSTYLQRFQHIFGQAVLIASYLSDAFVSDLKQVFPALWERVKQVQQERQRQIQKFYQQGVAAGVFQPINPILLMLQNEMLLGSIMDPIFLMEHDQTLRALLYDYYELQKYQWLAPEARMKIDDAPIKEYIDKMAQKISLGMRLDGGPDLFRS